MQTDAEYCPCLLAHYSGLSEDHGQGVNSTGVTSTAYPGASVPGSSFHTPSCPKIYEEPEGSSSHFNQQESAYAVPPQVLPCDYTSQVPATVSEKVLCDSGGNQDTGAYPASAPAEQWDTQVSWRYTFRLTRSPKLSLILRLTYRRSHDQCFALRAIRNRHVSHPRRGRINLPLTMPRQSLPLIVATLFSTLGGIRTWARTILPTLHSGILRWRGVVHSIDQNCSIPYIHLEDCPRADTRR